MIGTPLLGGTSVGCLTVVAEAACDQATVGTGASEHLWVICHAITSMFALSVFMAPVVWDLKMWDSKH